MNILRELNEMWLNRTICDVFSEMRKANETRNYSYILGLIEEAQAMANKMEAKLNDIRDLEDLRDNIKELEKRKKALRKEIDALKEEKNGDEE